MSQWKEDNNGEYKRVHKRQWRRRACIVYFYKTIWNHEYGFLGTDVYTAKPKGKFPCAFSHQAAGGVKRRRTTMKVEIEIKKRDLRSTWRSTRSYRT